MDCLKQKISSWISSSSRQNFNTIRHRVPQVIEDGGEFEKILKLDRELQIKEDSNIPQMSVKHGQVLYTSAYAMNIKAEEEVQDHLESLSSEEKEVIKEVMKRDRIFQREIAKELPKISVQSSVIVHVFKSSLDNKRYSPAIAQAQWV